MKKIFTKVLSDKFYQNIFLKYGINTAIEAGFICDNFDDKNYYNIDSFTTPTDKLNVNDVDNPIVLLATGAFAPLCDANIEMMELAKQVLSHNGYNVIGGYFSPSHDDYANTRPQTTKSASERVYEAQKALDNSDWLMVDPWESLYVSDCINFTDVINRLELYLKKHVDKNIRVAYVFSGDKSNFMYCFEHHGIGVCVERFEDDVYTKLKEHFACCKDCFFVSSKNN